MEINQLSSLLTMMRTVKRIGLTTTARATAITTMKATKAVYNSLTHLQLRSRKRAATLNAVVLATATALVKSRFKKIYLYFSILFFLG
jgi:hypothetical protein